MLASFVLMSDIVTCLWSEWLSSSGDGQLMWLQTWGHCLCMCLFI